MSHDAEEATKQITDDVYEKTSGIVQSGPFKGMKLLRELGWVDGALCPMVLGCYEQELHETLEYEITRLSKLPSPKIVNVGCAEGYYAIGLARRLPQAKVWAVDASEKCLNLAEEAAAANNVTLIIDEPIESSFAEPDLIIMDCEGFEDAYCDVERFPGLKKATLLVEIHNRADKINHTIVGGKMQATHSVEVIYEGARNPNLFFDLMYDKTSLWRWIAVCEHRPCLMYWFLMRPKNETSL